MVKLKRLIYAYKKWRLPENEKEGVPSLYYFSITILCTSVVSYHRCSEVHLLRLAAVAMPWPCDAVSHHPPLCRETHTTRESKVQTT